MNRTGFIDGILSIPGTLLSVESDDVRATVYGDVGVLTGRQRARGRWRPASASRPAHNNP